MTRTEELMKLCYACIDAEKPHHKWCADIEFRKLANPETIKQLIALVRLQHEALTFASDFIPAVCCKVGECEVCKAIEAFDKFERGEA